MGRYYAKKKSKGKRKSRFTKVEQAAFLFGQVERGLKNPDSRISESYNNGKKQPEKKQKKSLF